MLQLNRTTTRQRQDGMIALINIVFLLLVFFLIAGTLAAPLESELKLSTTTNTPPAPPPSALVMLSDGSLRFRGSPTDVETYLSQLASEDSTARRVEVAADRNLPATALIELLNELRQAGASGIHVMTERKVP